MQILKGEILIKNGEYGNTVTLKRVMAAGARR